MSQIAAIIAPVVPVILCAPKFLDGTMTLGQVMQAASAFTIVQSAFNWLVDNYPRLADWNASHAGRLANGVARLRWSAPRPAMTLAASSAAKRRGDASQPQRATVALDDGTAVVDEAEVAIKSGRACAGRRRFRQWQEHAGARDLGAVAVGRAAASRFIQIVS